MTNMGSAFCGVAPTGRGAAATSASAEAGAEAGGAVASAAGWAPGVEGAPGVLWEAVCPAVPLLAAGGTCDLKKQGVRNITKPIRRKAIRSRTSIDISFGGCAGVLLPPFTDSAIAEIFR